MKFNKPFVKRVGGVSRIIRDGYSTPDKSWYERGAEIRESSNYTCECGKYLGKGKGHVHHVIHRARGGLTENRNLVLLCEECHEAKHPHMSRKRHPS